MLSHTGSLALLLLLLPGIAFRVGCAPVNDRVLLFERNISSVPDRFELVNSSTTVLELPSTSRWDPIEYKIPATKQVLTGRIFTSSPIRPSSLHYVLDAGLGIAEARLASMGDVRLADHDNPFVYRVPGCDFQLASSVSDGEVKMTYGMMKEVFKALEALLERPQRFYEATFVLSDNKNHAFGHGEIFSTSNS
ncbi:MAG: hypothetical protein Q9191_000492 [Dirinaria sp. TL-2023a]